MRIPFQPAAVYNPVQPYPPFPKTSPYLLEPVIFMKLVSACLAGIPCRFDGNAKTSSAVQDLVSTGRALPLCPEQLGGLPTPRPAAEIQGGNGADVLAGSAKVMTFDGEDVTEQFIKGAEEAANQAVEAGVSEALLKSKSPACGCTRIFDGTHSGRLTDGQGVFAAALEKRGIRIVEI